MTANSPSAVAHASAHKLFSFRRAAAIAGNTLRDLVRQKVFYFMLVFAVVLIGMSLVLAALSFQGQLQTVMDVSKYCIQCGYREWYSTYQFYN